MAHVDVLYVTGLEESSGTESEEDTMVVQNAWDDRKLNNAYDRAINIANVEIARRIAMATNTGKKDYVTSKNGKAAGASEAKKSSKNKPKKKWVEGMPCRAVYHADGVEYEGIVLSIMNEQECIVKFLGYDNTEIVDIDSLQASKGKEEQRLQMAQAIKDNGDEAFENLSSEPDNILSGASAPTTNTSDKRHNPRPKISPKSKQNARMNFNLPDNIQMPNMSMLQGMGSMNMPLPPPPPLGFPKEQDGAEDQALSSMLLSWYMSGYYTGLYQGMKRGRSNV